MHISSRKHKGQSGKKMILPATPNDFHTVTDSISDNAIITTQERSKLSPIMLPKDWDMDPDGYKIIDKIDIISQNSLSQESSMTTITPKTIPADQPIMESVTQNAAPSLNSVLITLNRASHTTPTSVTSTSTIIHTTLSTVPTNNEITSTSSKMIAESELTTVKESSSLKPSISSPSEILNESIPSGKSWLSDGLQSILNSQIPPEKYSQEELSKKKLSFGSFEFRDSSDLGTFSTTINSNNNPSLATTTNTSRILLMPIDDGSTIQFNSIRNLSPNAVDTTISSVRLRSVGESRKSMKESEENYFNADSSIFMNAQNFRNQSRTVSSPHRIKNNNVNTMTEQSKLILDETKETKEEKGEGKIEIMDDFSSTRDLQRNMPVKTENDIIHQFLSTIQREFIEVSATPAPSDSQADLVTDHDYRITIAKDHSLHPSKHQEHQHFFRTTIKQGSILCIIF